MGKMSMENIEFTVFGNGRVRCRVVDAGGRHRVLDEFERDIGPAQVQELVETAVPSGLADFDAHGYVEQIQEAGGRVPQNEDGVDVLFKIELDHSSHSFLLDSPDEFARRFPSDARFRSWITSSRCSARSTGSIGGSGRAHTRPERPLADSG